MISIEVSVDSAIRRCLIYIESNMDLTYWTWTRGEGGGVKGVKGGGVKVVLHTSCALFVNQRHFLQNGLNAAYLLLSRLRLSANAWSQGRGCQNPASAVL